MFAEEDQHGTIEDMHIAEGRLAGAHSLVVEDAQGKIPILPTCLAEPIGEIDVLAVHKKVGVEQSHLFQSFSPNKEKGSADNLDFGRLVPRKIAHVVARKAPARREAGTEAAHLPKSRHRRGNSPTTLQSIRTIGIQHPHPHGSRPIVGIHEADRLAERVLRHDHIGIQQQDILAGRGSDRPVISTGETVIVL